MYALVTLWSLLAIGAAGRWLGLGRRIRGDTRPAGWGWLASYVAAITLALYTQYYAGLPAGGPGRGRRGGVVASPGRAGARPALAGRAGRGHAALPAVAALRCAEARALRLAEDRRRLRPAAGAAALPGPPPGSLQRWPSGRAAGGLVAVGPAGGNLAGCRPGSFGPTPPAGAGAWPGAELPGHHPGRGAGAGLAGQPGLSVLPGARRTPAAAGLARVHPAAGSHLGGARSGAQPRPAHRCAAAAQPAAAALRGRPGRAGRPLPGRLLHGPALRRRGLPAADRPGDAMGPGRGYGVRSLSLAGRLFLELRPARRPAA